jgi:predicted RNA-binding protein with PIN domain
MARPLIVDGYNVLFACTDLAHLARRSIEEGRHLLIDYLAAKVGKYDITIVYDGWLHGSASQSTTRSRGVRVVFSRQGERADEVIKRLIDASNGTAIVVSNDNEVRAYALGASCAVAGPDSLIKPARPAAQDSMPRQRRKGLANRPKRNRGPGAWRF